MVQDLLIDNNGSEGRCVHRVGRVSRQIIQRINLGKRKGDIIQSSSKDQWLRDGVEILGRSSPLVWLFAGRTTHDLSDFPRWWVSLNVVQVLIESSVSQTFSVVHSHTDAASNKPQLGSFDP